MHVPDPLVEVAFGAADTPGYAVTDLTNRGRIGSIHQEKEMREISECRVRGVSRLDGGGMIPWGPIGANRGATPPP